MTICSDKIKQNVFIVLKNSGYSFQEYGQYYQCLNLNPIFNYNFLQLKVTKGSSSIITNMGLCLPSQCQPAQIIQYTNEVFQNMSISASVSGIKYAMKNIDAQFGFAFYFFTFIIILLVGMIAYSTYMKYRSNESKLSMFSLQESSKYFKTNPNSTNVFNGLKTISMLMIVAAHSIRNGGLNSINLLQQSNIVKNVYMLFIQTQEALSAFFYMGGFLVSYLVIRQVMKGDWKLIMNILNRALRILPSFLFIIMFYIAYYSHLGSGQLWNGNNPPLGNYQNCYHVWKIILFIDNFYQFGGQMCYTVAWYLYPDMQLFIISMFVLKLYPNHRKACKILIIILIILGVLQNFIYCQLTGFIDAMVQSEKSSGPSYWAFQYTKPWRWMSPYFFGFLSGMFYYQYLQQTKKIQKQIKNSNKSPEQIQRKQLYSNLQSIFKQKKWIRILTQLIGFLLILFYAFITRTRQLGILWPHVIYSLHTSTLTISTAFGINLLILPTLLGQRKSIVTFLLDTTFFNFIGKISFLTFLIHYNFTQTIQLNRTSTYYYQFVPKFVQFLSALMISMILSVIIVFLVEAPFSSIQKILITKLKQTCNESTKKQNANDQIQGTLKQQNNITNNPTFSEIKIQTSYKKENQMQEK